MLLTCTVLLGTIFPASNVQAEGINIDILYIEAKEPAPAVLSNLAPPPKDEGLRGIEQAIADNNTTGKFLKQNYKFTPFIIKKNDDFDAKLKEALETHKTSYIVSNMIGSKLLKLAKHPLAKDRLIFNASAQNNELRNENCQANILHTVPSYRMRTDALGQFLSKKNWKKIFLIEGRRPIDKAFAKSFRDSASKYRLNIVTDKEWPSSGDMRRNAAKEVPAFTQGGDYDAIFIADETRDFAQYVQYHTWLPRPVIGSQGLTPAGWSWVIEQWGAAQLQKRFQKLTGRKMTTIDYSAWAGVRTIGEAVTRLNSADLAKTNPFIRGPKIKLAMFKGRAMSYRSWSGQMRQSIPLVNDRAVVTLTPLPGFLHPKTELDTIGFDEKQTKCKLPAMAQ